MAGEIRTALTDLAPDTIDAQPVTFDKFGRPANNGSALTALPVRFSSVQSVQRSPAGEEVTVGVKAVVFTTTALSPRDYRFDLPARFTPNTGVEAIAGGPVTDENGVHHNVLWFR